MAHDFRLFPYSTLNIVDLALTPFLKMLLNEFFFIILRIVCKIYLIIFTQLYGPLEIFKQSIIRRIIDGDRILFDLLLILVSFQDRVLHHKGFSSALTFFLSMANNTLIYRINLRRISLNFATVRASDALSGFDVSFNLGHFLLRFSYETSKIVILVISVLVL